MAHPGAYRGNKRQKELKRLEKQEAKRQKRQHKYGGPEAEPDTLTEGAVPSEGQEPKLESPQEQAPEAGGISPPDAGETAPDLT